MVGPLARLVVEHVQKGVRCKRVTVHVGSTAVSTFVLLPTNKVMRRPVYSMSARNSRAYRVSEDDDGRCLVEHKCPSSRAPLHVRGYVRACVRACAPFSPLDCFRRLQTNDEITKTRKNNARTGADEDVHGADSEEARDGSLRGGVSCVIITAVIVLVSGVVAV